MLIKNYKSLSYEGVEDKKVLLFNLVLRTKLSEETKRQLSDKISRLFDICDIFIKGKGIIASFGYSRDVCIMPQKEAVIEYIHPNNLNRNLVFLYSDKNYAKIEYKSNRYNIIYEYPYENKKLNNL